MVKLLKKKELTIRFGLCEKNWVKNYEKIRYTRVREVAKTIIK